MVILSKISILQLQTPSSLLFFSNTNESDTCNLKPLVLSPSMWLLCCVVSLGQSLAGEQEDSTVMRALTSHQCGLCSILTQYHMWGEFVVGSCFAPSLSSGFSGFPLLVYLHKNQDLQIPIWLGLRTCIKPAKADEASSLNIVKFIFDFIFYTFSTGDSSQDH